MQERQRQRVYDLLRAQIEVGKISSLVGLNRTTVWRLKKQMDAGKEVKRMPGSAGVTKVLTPDFLASLKAEVEDNPHKSIRKIARERGVADWTIRSGLKKLGFESRVRPSQQFLSEKTKATRLTKAKKLYQRFKNKMRDTVIIYSDKKMFTVDPAHNRRNDRHIVPAGTPPKPITKTKHPAGVMVLGIVASDGKKCPPYYFPQGLRITSKVYIRVLRTHVLPWLEANYPDGNYIFQQDSAPAHRAKKTQEWMEKNLANFWPWSLWPPAAPDNNPLDYAVWGLLDGKVRAIRHSSVDHLKASIAREWEDMSAAFIKKSCASFRGRLKALIEAEGGHFEKH